MSTNSAQKSVKHDVKMFKKYINLLLFYNIFEQISVDRRKNYGKI